MLLHGVVLHVSDIDECGDGTICHVNATCSNTFGSFNCSCNKGFLGDGFQCEGKNYSQQYFATYFRYMSYFL